MRARDNPFAVHRVLRVRYRLDESAWQQLFQRLERLDFRGALVGPEGSGKTTLLEDMAERFVSRGQPIRWLRLSREQPRWQQTAYRRWLAELCPTDMVLLDGAEQMRWWRWKFFLKEVQHTRGLVITCHRTGRLPTLRSCVTSVKLAEQLVEQLVGPLHPLSQQKVAELYGIHGGNLRDVLRDLYDWYAHDESL
jgi:hypothetical protein